MAFDEARTETPMEEASKAKTPKEVIEAAQEEWDKLDWQAIYNIIEDMPRRLNAVIDAEGG